MREGGAGGELLALPFIAMLLGFMLAKGC